MTFSKTVLFSLLIFIGCFLRTPQLELSSSAALVDERIGIKITHLTPGDTVSIRATTFDQRQRPWHAEATFVVGSDKTIDLATQAPIAGTYDRADAMGLLWSARPEREGAIFAQLSNYTYTTAFELVSNGKVVDRDTLTRRFLAPDVVREDIRTEEVVGTFFRPNTTGKAPAVVVFAGSDGGLVSAEWRAALLASRGFSALAVAYFKYEGRPADLVELPLEDAYQAITWMRDKTGAAQVGLVGFSKGTELALNLASRFDHVGAVIAISPSAYVWPGLSDGPPERRSSWSLAGTPLPAIAWSVGPKAGQMFSQGPPFRLRLLYEESLEAASAASRAAAQIPVTQIKAPILLVSGGDDGSWPASEMSRTIVTIMREAGKGNHVQHLEYPEAGHLLFWDYLPTTISTYPGQVFGGTPEATSAAQADAWPAIQQFLKDALK